MPSYIVTCKDDATPEQVDAAKKAAVDQGGKIGHEYTLIKGFSVTFPSDSVQTLASHEHVKAVEADKETPHHHHQTPFVNDDDQVPRLAKQPQHPLSLADLVKHGRPPLSAEALLSSARFTLSLLPIRLAHRIQALRNLPYIVVSNPNISKIYNNYQRSLSTLLPYLRDQHSLSSLDDEIRFTEVLAELVHTHTDTIPILARGFLECRRYIGRDEVTRFLDEHLRARIGTRLIAEQHIALHFSSAPHFDPEASPTPCPEHPSYIGVIDTALRPADVVDACGGFVADICELKYGLRPRWVIDGEPDTTFAFVPMHLEYILTELLKNAFRATVEAGGGSSVEKDPVVITIAPEPPGTSAATATTSTVATSGNAGTSTPGVTGSPGGQVQLDAPQESRGAFQADAIRPLDDNAPGVTIRIRDRGGGINPEVLPNIWSYSFTTFSEDDEVPGGSIDALNAISGSGGGAGSSIAGLGYGLPLSRAYAEYFGGGIAVQSLYGWGTDVYLRLKGVGKIE
ncbi:Alpha-ketoacid dehydrogenase kinase [Pleurostoma richardsiae]|uniref:Protein-serine/threonine kinase n=1 Tax=Pleurostoma richardsiae TaxID=41990 RepID=A0AA38RHT2_9PEZI|nr:Alpha-ketoacid dehydrogenase kinase [Pleurostoma richardsiae]